MSDLDLISIPALVGGVSRQPDHTRFPEQVEVADNIIPDVTEGSRKRPGTRFIKQLSGPEPAAASVIRMHTIDRDTTEKYIVLYGTDSTSSNIILRVFSSAGTEATVTISAAAEAYLERNAPSADALRLVTMADFTLIINSTVAAVTTFTADYSVTGTFDTQERMKQTTPTDGTYHQVDDEYFQYDVDAITFAKIQFPAVSGYDWGQPRGEYDDSGNNLNVKLIASRQNLNFSAATFTAVALTLTKAGAFTNYVFQTGDKIKITGGTAVVAGWYGVASRTDANTIVLTAEIAGGASPVDVTATYIGTEYSFNWVTPATAEDDMGAVAAVMQEQFDLDSGTPWSDRVLVAWTSTGADSGYMTVTSPYRGGGATIEMQAYGSGTDLNASGRPFYATGATITAGSGSPSGNNPADFTNEVDDRWVQVNAPGETDAGLEPDSLPVQMTRDTISPLAFSVNQIAWSARADGDNLTNPSPEIFRPSEEGQITAISLASPGVVTSAAHGLATGDAIHIVGTDSTPSIDGRQTVTVLTADTFHVSINTTGAGTTGTWGVAGKKITAAAFFENRLWLMGDEFIVGSQSGDLFNFYKDDAANAVDSDPIERRVSGNEVSILDFAVPIRSGLFLMSRSGRQFELRGGENGLTPTNATIITSTKTRTVLVAPALLGSLIYFVGEIGAFTVLWEYQSADEFAPTSTGDTRAHAGDFVPTGITSVAADEPSRTVVLTKRDTNTLYVYRAFWSGREKVQSAWSTFTFDSTYDILDAQFLVGNLWMLTETGGKFILEYMPLSPLGASSGFDYEVFGDRQVSVTGAFGGVNTVFALGMTGSSSTITRLVKGTAFGAASGDVLSTGGSWSFSGTDLTIASTDLSAGAVILCDFYTATIEPSRPFRRDERGRSVLGERLILKRLAVACLDSGAYSVVVDTDNRAARTVTFTPTDGDTDQKGLLIVTIGLDADRADITISSSELTSMTITGLEYLVEAASSMRTTHGSG